MFNSNFFPTPSDVIKVMLEGFKIRQDTIILEPSAGKGDILDYIHNNYLKDDFRYYSNQKEAELKTKANLYCIESEEALTSILLDKNYQYVDKDFLTHVNERNYDLIIMNPPFDQGERHLIKALEIGPYSEIRCLLNMETFRNPCNKYRKTLISMLKNRQGNVINLGRCFSNAERPTQVEVALVIVKAVPQENQFRFTFDASKMDGREKLFSVKDIKNNQLETTDVVGSLVHRYNKVKEIAAEINTLYSEMRFYAQGLVAEDDTLGQTNLSEVSSRSYETFVHNFRKSCWQSIFTQTKLTNYVTSTVKKDILEHQEKHSKSRAFNESNILEMFLQLMGAYKDIRKNCVEEAFAKLTHYYDENRLIPEGWKTNKAWIVNRKCIIPNAVDNRWTNKSWHYAFQEKMADIEKALSMISGQDYSKIQKECLGGMGTYSISELEYGKWHDSHFFTYKFFKKGTCHFVFKDLELWKAFNREACRGRNWVGGGFEEPTEMSDDYQMDIKALVVV